jgi:hypothetical protein
MRCTVPDPIVSPEAVSTTDHFSDEDPQLTTKTLTDTGSQ